MTPRKLAQLAGDKTYIGKRCKYDHDPMRFTADKKCVECCRLYASSRRDVTRRLGLKKGSKIPVAVKHEFPVTKTAKRIAKEYAKYDLTTEVGKWIKRSKMASNLNKKSRKNLKVSDYEKLIVTHCPLLNMELTYSLYKGRTPDNYATLDRIDSNLDYLPTNIQIISLRANTIKNNATLSELQTLVKNWKKNEKL